MDIFLSVNNREQVLQLPVVPSEFTITKPQNNEVFETATQGDLKLIGSTGLKGIVINSFFPVKDYPFVRDTTYKGFEYVYIIDNWIFDKLPIWLIITDTPINMVVVVDNFQYTLGTDGNLYYTLELATSLDFEIAKLDAQHTTVYIPQVGSIISMVTNAEVFRGIVLAVDDGSLKSSKYTVCDFGFYLNKSSETYQFNNMPANQLIEKICSDFNIAVDSICNIPDNISRIYFDKTISGIMEDVLEQCDGQFNFDVTPRGLRVYRIGDLWAYPEFRLSSNTQLLYSPNLKGNVSHSTSIEDMKNQIKVITSDDDSFDVKVTVQDQQLINKYGLLQQVVKVDAEQQNPYTVADDTLKQLSAIQQSYSFEMIEALDSYTRAGYLITLQDIDYLIEESSHSIKNGIHYTKLDLRRWLT